jgi:hypothetical protein
VTVAPVPWAPTDTPVRDSLGSWLEKATGGHADGEAAGEAAGDGLAAGDGDGEELGTAEGAGLTAGDGLGEAVAVHPAMVTMSAARAMTMRRIMRSSVRDAR